MQKSGLLLPLRICFFMWLVFAVEFYLKVDLGHLGINPRNITGVVGIIMAPLLHGNFSHLASNTLPFLALGGTLFFFYPNFAYRTFLHCYLFTNVLVWIFGRPFYHIGASGLVYALASFLVFYGLFTKNFKTVIISAVVIFSYGGMAYGLLSLDDRISWESHLMGAIVGIVTAFINSKSNKKY